MRLRIEKRSTPSRLVSVLTPFVSLLLALFVAGLLLQAVHADPIKTYMAMFKGAFGSRYGLSETLVKAIPLMLCALGVSVAFRMHFWNIGAEGQLVMGGIAGPGGSLSPASSPLHVCLANIASSRNRWLRSRRTMGTHSSYPQSLYTGQRNHHHTHAELYRYSHGRVSLLRTLEGSKRLRFSRDSRVSRCCLASTSPGHTCSSGVCIRTAGSRPHLAKYWLAPDGAMRFASLAKTHVPQLTRELA